MKKKFKESKYYEDWIAKAKRDLETAILNHRHGGYTDTTCYFCHQVAEKVLKAYLLYKGMKFLPKIHILPTLLSLSLEEDKDFSELKDSCDRLDDYYIETKYPAGPPVDYPKDEAEEALKLAKEVLEFIGKKIER